MSAHQMEAKSSHKGTTLDLLVTLQNRPQSFYPTKNQGANSVAEAGLEPIAHTPGKTALSWLGRAKSDVNQPLLPPVRVRKPAGDLYLSGLTSLSDAATESLSGHEGNCLYLNGLTSLSDAAAESLSSHRGELHLCLGELPESAVAILCRHWSFQDDEDDDEDWDEDDE